MERSDAAGATRSRYASRTTAWRWIAWLLLIAPADLLAAPFWGAKESRPAETDPATLRPGEFVWDGDAVPAGPVVVAVSLEEQCAYVYRNGVRIGVSTVSTGKPGHQTPTGVFMVLEKDANHRSKTYNNAPMPYSERLTWGGVALHAGELPGYPSSHGCVHLPSEFARLLFKIAPMHMIVVIADSHTPDENVRHPTAVAPLDAKTGADVETPPLAPTQDQRWTPEAAPDGPLSILVSGGDRRILVFRNGIEIGRARLGLRDPEEPLGTHAFVLLDAGAPGASPRPSETNRRWIAVSVPGHERDAGLPLDPEQVARVSIPPEFRAKLRDALAPGATMVVTDGAVLPQTSGVAMTIVTADAPPEPR